MEKISENQARKTRKRGRPMTNGNEEFLAMGSPHLTSRRGRIEAMLAECAFGAFASVAEQRPIPAWLWFYVSAKGTSRRRTILAALGRIEDDAELLRLAQDVAEQRMSTRRAVTHIRAHRQGRPPKASAIDLANRIIKVVNTYFADYPTISWPLVQEALEIAIEAVNNAAAGREKPDDI